MPSYLVTPLANEPSQPNGHVTFKGTGRHFSHISSNAWTINSHDCDQLEFQDLSIDAKGLGYSVFWRGTGSSVFTNVDLNSEYGAWYDTTCSGAPTDGPTGEHYFYSSKLSGELIGVYAQCARIWLYGSEIHVKNDDTPNAGGRLRGVQVGFRGDVRLFGSAIRVDHSTPDFPGYPVFYPSYGVQVGISDSSSIPDGGGAFHMHGGIINVSGGNLDRTIYGVSSESTISLAHVIDTAFVMHTGPNGTANRLVGNGMKMSPFLWQQGITPPVTGSNQALISTQGADMFIETDCDGTGDCSSGIENEPHLMIYSTQCASTNPWFDVVTGACRK
ncbi:hypothetical protein [Oceanicoccus sp. KOV_DT_Chl]|uniref:hypothetical protein n=1 Tax=Oceanicoccus sp. KOV_DT_Chl TaxID=1904639 RepID=UPI000C79CF25|nr:hypothetical protein [Oceanicoccus sp. KOV_DT_Chl]